MSRLVIFGDSNSWGVGLPDPQTQTYGYHLSQLSNRELVNKANPGSSNSRIMYEILNFKFEPTDLVIIAWTYNCRETLYFSKDKVSNLGSWVDDKVRQNRVWLEYMYDVHDLSVKSYMHMHHAQLLLKQLNVENIQMMLEDDVEALNVKKSFDWSDNITMTLDIIKEAKYVDLTECRHPGPKTHKLVADHLYNKFKDMF